MNLSDAKNLIENYAVDIIDLCPHCDAKVHAEKLWQDYHVLKNRDIVFYVTFRCKPCRKLILKTHNFRQNPFSQNTDLDSIGWNEKFPSALDSELSLEESEHIPKDVFSDYQEALKCKSIGANKASCAMFRRSLQNGLIKLGANSDIDLINQIDSLNNLPEDIKDWAHQIRIFGNWGAHPDKDNLKDISQNDVNEAHDFISKFFVYVFVMPEKVKLSRKNRQEKIAKK